MTADPTHPTDQPPPESSVLWEFVRTLLIVAVLALVFRALAYEPFRIPSGSMKSTLLVRDHLFVSKFSYGYSRYSFPFAMIPFAGRVPEPDLNPQLRRGDILVFRPATLPHVDYIKRLIGLPGDRVQMRGGELYLNGQPVARERIEDFLERDDTGQFVRTIRYRETLPNGVSYHTLDTDPFSPSDNTDEYVVPPGHVFMMGDNRDNSTDSRFLSDVGYVPVENIIGRAEIIFFSAESGSFWNLWHGLDGLRAERFFMRL